MPTSSPTIFLTFAQDRQKPGRFLPGIIEERSILKDTLEPYHELGGRVEVASSADPKYWVKEVQVHQRQTVIFHFSGHGNPNSLQFEGSEGHRIDMPGEMLATLFSNEVSPNIKLVFLNACATKDQFEHFKKVGVPAVIATPYAIRDEQAVTFSEIFYRALLAGKTLKQSYEEAQISIYPAYPSKGGMYRGFELVDDKVGEEQWGLYVQHESAESWRLISPPSEESSPSGRGVQSNGSTNELDWRQLHKLITRNRFRKVLKILEESVPDEYLIEVGALRGRLEEIETKYIQGTYSSTEETTDKNKFRVALLQFVRNLEEG